MSEELKQDESIATWQERQEAVRAQGYNAPDDRSFLLAEIADLRAALARRATAGNAAPIYQIEGEYGSGSGDVSQEVYESARAEGIKTRIVYLAGNATARGELQPLEPCKCTRAQKQVCDYCAGYGKEIAPSNTSPVGAESDKA